MVGDAVTQDTVSGFVNDLRALHKTKSSRHALMLALPAAEALGDVPFDAAVLNSSELQFISRDSSKPGRARADGIECWVAEGEPI